MELPKTELQAEFCTGLTPVEDHYQDLLETSDRALTKELYWVALGEADYLQLRDLHTFDLHLKYFARNNLSLGYTAWSALVHYFCELDQTATLGDRAVETVFVVGLRLEANKLHDWFLNSKLGLFNRLYTEYYLTV